MARKKELGTKIKKWIEHDGLNVELLLRKGYEFQLPITNAYGLGLEFLISQREAKDVIIIASTINQPKEVTDIFKKLSKTEKVSILQSMHRELLKIIQDHHIGNDLKSISLIERIYIENLTRQKFMESLLRLRNMDLYLISVLRHHFGQQEPPPPVTPDVKMYG